VFAGKSGFFRASFGGGYFDFHRRFFAVDLLLAALAFDGFVVLFTHKCLYFVRGLRFRVSTMSFYGRRFNLYLLLPVALVLVCGCATHKKDKQLAALRIHIESHGNLADSSQTVPVMRDQPVLVTIASEPILSEANIIAATLLETPGGCAVEVKFDESGAWTLEQFSASNPGRHFAIFGQWGEKLKEGRWLAAPLISHHIANGILAFTADASREELQQLVLGLKRVAKQNAKAK